MPRGNTIISLSINKLEHGKATYSTEACTTFQLAISRGYLLKHTTMLMFFPSKTLINKQFAEFGEDMSLHSDFNMEVFQL